MDTPPVASAPAATTPTTATAAATAVTTTTTGKRRSGGGVWSAVRTFIARRAPRRLRALLAASTGGVAATTGAAAAAAAAATATAARPEHKYRIDTGAPFAPGDAAGDGDAGDDDAQIGVGQAGTRVYRAVEAATGRRVAIKAVSKKVLTKAKMADIRREARVMGDLARLPVPGIVRFYDFFEDKANMYIVMELMEGGELFAQIAQRGSFTEQDACTVVVQVAHALRGLHDHGYIHRDLKPENLLCARPDGLDVIKLCDFGMTKKIDNGTATTPCGTVTYVAPEVIIMKGDDESQRGYGRKADVWSLGVILYVLLSGRPPFYDATPNGVLNRIRRGDYEFAATEWAYVSPSAKDLIAHCLETDPAKRFAISDVLAHRWIHEAMAVPPAMSPLLQSPTALRDASLPINEFFKLLMPRLNMPSSPSPEPVRLAVKGPAHGNKENRAPAAGVAASVTKPAQPPGLGSDGMLAAADEQFFRWRLSDDLVFEVPGYYRALRSPKFGPGANVVSCVAWNTDVNADTMVRKSPRVAADREQCIRLVKEITILRALQHENLLNLIDGFVSPSEDVYLVSELTDMTLRDLLLERPTAWDPEEVQLTAFYLLRGLNHLHAAGLMHHDLKPSAIFVNLSFNKVCSLKIGDLSRVRVRHEPLPRAGAGNSESRHYRAPELLLGATSYDASVDIWAAACCIGEMLTRKLLFPGGKSDVEVLHSIVKLIGLPNQQLLLNTYRCPAETVKMFADEEMAKNVTPSFGKRFPSATADCIDLLGKMLSYDPRRRPCAGDALAHRFFGKFWAIACDDVTPEVFSPAFDERPHGIKWKNHLYDLLETFHEVTYDTPQPAWDNEDEEDECDEDSSQRTLVAVEGEGADGSFSHIYGEASSSSSDDDDDDDDEDDN